MKWIVSLTGAKGGIGTLLMEKVVATPSKGHLVVGKQAGRETDALSTSRGSSIVQSRSSSLVSRTKPSFRERWQRFVTDMQNFIIDLAWMS